MKYEEQNPSIIDINDAIRLAAGKSELAKDLFNMLIASLPEARQKIRQLEAAQDSDALFQEVHRLQGAARYCGVPALLQACQAAESLIKGGALADFQAQLAHLYEEIERLLAWAQNNEWRAP